MSNNYGSLPKYDSDDEDFVNIERKHGNYWKCYSVFALLATMVCFFPMVSMTIGPTAFYSIMNIPFANTPTAKPSASPREAGLNNIPYVVSTNKPTSKPVMSVSEKTGAWFSTYRNGYSSLAYFNEDASDIYKYVFLESYAGVVEPSATMWFNMTDTKLARTSRFSVCNSAMDDCVTGNILTASFSFDCTPLEDTYDVSITLASGEVVASGSLMCMYVRREFGDLTGDDLAKTMDAMWKMWELSEDDGQALYGDAFHNYAYLLEFHYFNAAWIHSDHVHEGNGFLAQHIKMTNIFELSMQAVDPSVTMPYWDFTKENAQGVEIWDSALFTANTFGSMVMPNNDTWGWLFSQNDVDDGKIPDGRWANLKADKNTKYTELDYAYGYMRAPWNMNPSQYVTRYTSVDKTLPSCESHYTLLEYSEIVDFLHQVPYAAHASSHGVIGGVFGCDAMDSLREAGYINGVEGQLNLCKNWIFYLKEFYRSAVLLPSSGCVAEDSGGDYSTAYDDLSCDYICDNSRMSILFLMLQHSVLNSDYDCVPEYGVMPDEGWKAWKDFICGGDGSKVFGGDHLESASPADPSFWPIHPTLERLLQVKYMTGGFTSDEWPSDSSTEYVCNKATCYEEDEGDFGQWSSCCYGHYQDDQMLDAPNNDRYSFVGPTNREVHDGTNPTSSDYSMPYIYDGFSWSHCLESGYDFDDLIVELYNNGTFNVSSSNSEKGW